MRVEELLGDVVITHMEVTRKKAACSNLPVIEKIPAAIEAKSYEETMPINLTSS